MGTAWDGRKLRLASDLSNGICALSTPSPFSSYDRFGRLTRWSQNGYEALFDYADDLRYVFQRVKQSSSVYRQSVRRFNALGRLRLVQVFENGEAFSSMNESNGIKTRSEYHWGSDGNREVTSNPFRDGSESSMGWTRTSRDTTGRPVELRHYSGSALPAPWGQNAATTGASTTLYDGPKTTQTDPAGVKLESTVDGAGRLVRVIENPGGTSGTVHATNYQYSALGNLVRVEQPLDSNIQVRQFVYSSLSQLISASNPETTGPIAYSYDSAGNLLTRSHGGVVTSNTVDALNRTTLTTYSDGTPSVRYCYDGNVSYAGEDCATPSPSISNAIGRLTSVSNSVSGNLFPEFDGLGRVLRSVQKTGTHDPFEFAYNYNLAGDLTQITYPSGRKIDYTYDNAGRATSVARNGGATYLSVAAFHAHGAPAMAVLGNSLTEQSCFNARLQGVGMRVGEGESPGCGVLAADRIGISMDFGTSANNGNVRSQTVARGGAGAFSQAFRYDAFNRLCSAVEGPGSGAPVEASCTSSAALGSNHWLQRYGFDRFGNRWVAQTDSNNTQTVDPQTPATDTNIDWATNRIIGPGTYTYGDGRGNLTGLGARQFSYDAESRLKQSQTGSGPETTYHYDGAGRRVKKEAPAATTVYVYDAMGQLAAEYATGVQAKTGTEYLTVDHLGSTRLVTNASGTVVSRHDFLPFGEEINAGVGGRTTSMGYAQDPYAAIDPTQRFTGKERDAETGLDYFGARYLSGAMGRFTGSDPLLASARLDNPQSWNRYAYAFNSPLRYTDPTGMAVEGDDESKQIYEDARRLMRSVTSDLRLMNMWLGVENSRTNLEKRKAVADTAQGYKGSTDWSFYVKKDNFPANSNKCNKFVCDVVSEAGAPAPRPGSPWPFTAIEWAATGKISNWRKLEAGEAPKAGDVFAFPMPHDPSAAQAPYTGHTGIIVEIGGKLYAVSAHDDKVGVDPLAEYSGFKGFTVRRYTGD